VLLIVRPEYFERARDSRSNLAGSAPARSSTSRQMVARACPASQMVRACDVIDGTDNGSTATGIVAYLVVEGRVADGEGDTR
jgi:hypothetical protein